MPEATIEKEDGELLIKSGAFMFRKGGLYKNWYHLREFSASDMDDLYAVLHARHVAQHYNAELMARIEKAVEAVKDDGLYKGGD